MLIPIKIALFLRETALFYTNFNHKFSSLWSKVKGHKWRSFLNALIFINMFYANRKSAGQSLKSYDRRLDIICYSYSHDFWFFNHAFTKDPAIGRRIRVTVRIESYLLWIRDSIYETVRKRSQSWDNCLLKMFSHPRL